MDDKYINDRLMSEENLKALRLEELGRYLKQARKAKDLDVRTLGNMLNVSGSYISKIEMGKTLNPQPEILKKLANILGVNYLELLRILDYIDLDSFKMLQKKRKGTAIIDVSIYDEIKKENRDNSFEKKIGQIRYLSPIDNYKYLKGYVIKNTPNIFGIPTYTYAIFDLAKKIQSGNIGIFKINGIKVLKRYIKIGEVEILIDINDRSDIYEIKQTDSLSEEGLFIDYIVDVNGEKLENGKDTPVFLTDGGYKRREP